MTVHFRGRFDDDDDCLKKSYELFVNVVRTGGICEINIALIWTIWTILNDSTIDFPIPNLILK